MRHEDLKGIHHKLDQILEGQPVQTSSHAGEVSPTIKLFVKTQGDEVVSKIEAQFSEMKTAIADLRKDVRDDMKELTSNMWKGIGALGVIAAIITACSRIFH
ncbi:hypothetical protein [Paraburkholderia sp. BL21I4N1]|uniref:hypothetical protein n=1 Tax=Paraburkholderia sp. BL21I4N1 TaxID=1938801 RepID=UPI000CFE0542|nr:hypothetical protein [Paraburkholderia sp. BL21I4N1]PQV53361.1 hypothetical protein B0G83_102447 [Paraburkholderia sp. BL21I4N1]